MKITSSKANKLLKSYNDELERVISLESQSSIFNASINEKIEDVRPQYDFKGTQNSIDDLELKIINLKHCINVFNTTTKLPCGLTIDEALVKLPMLNKQLTKFKDYISRLPKKRCSNGWNNSSIVEYTYINYDLKEVKEAYEKISELVNKIQLELDNANNTLTIEVED